MPVETSASQVLATATTSVGEGTRLRGTAPNNVDTRWSVAIAAGFIAFFGVASMSNLGFFYVYFLEEFHTNRENASWPGSVLQIMGHVAGIIVAVLQRFLSTFYIGLIGSVVLWAGLLLAVLAPNIAWMTVTFGFVHGAGVGIIMVTVIVSIMSNFQKYRGLAAGFKYTGNTLASLLLPKVLSSLQDVYTFRGTLLIYAALSMHATAFTLFLKDRPKRKKSVPGVPPKQQDSRTDLSSVPSEGLFETILSNENVENVEKTNARKRALNGFMNVTRSAGDSSRVIPFTPTNNQIDRDTATEKCFCEAARRSRDSDAQGVCSVQNAGLKQECLEAINLTEKSHYQGDDGGIGKHFMGSENYNLASDEDQMPKLDHDRNEICTMKKRSGASEPSYGIFHYDAAQPPSGHSSAIPLSGSNTCNSSNLQLFVAPTFYVLVLGAIAADLTTLIVHGSIVDYALDKGVARKSAEMSMTYCASTELVGRLLLPLAADLRFVSRTNLVATCFTAMAVTSLALPHTASFASYIPIQVATALFLACVATLKGVLVADSFGPDAVPTFWGANGVALIPVLLGIPFITGYFRDTMGSYDNLFRLLAGVQLFTGGVFYTLACFQRKRNTLPS